MQRLSGGNNSRHWSQSLLFKGKVVGIVEVEGVGTWHFI